MTRLTARQRATLRAHGPFTLHGLELYLSDGRQALALSAAELIDLKQTFIAVANVVATEPEEVVRAREALLREATCPHSGAWVMFAVGKYRAAVCAARKRRTR